MPVRRATSAAVSPPSARASARRTRRPRRSDSFRTSALPRLGALRRACSSDHSAAPAPPRRSRRPPDYSAGVCAALASASSDSSLDVRRWSQRNRTRRIAVTRITSVRPNATQAQISWNSLSTISFASVETESPSARSGRHDGRRPAAHREAREDDRQQLPDDDREREQAHQRTGVVALPGEPVPADRLRSRDVAGALPGRGDVDAEHHDAQHEDDLRAERPVPEAPHRGSVTGRRWQIARATSAPSYTCPLRYERRRRPRAGRRRPSARTRRSPGPSARRPRTRRRARAARRAGRPRPAGRAGRG